MWTRVELKDKAKGALKGNYWKAVLVAVLLMFVSGGVGSAVSGSEFTTVPALSDAADSSSVDDSDFGDYYYDDEYLYYDDMDVYGDALDEYYAETNAAPPAYVSVLAGLGLFVVFLAVFAVCLALDILIANPLLVGAQRFFVRDLNQKAEVKEVTHAFDNGNYIELIKTMFLRDLFIALWALLFIVPGIVKAYEYRMIPYLLAEDPTMTKDQAFAESKRMMTGQKWNAFVLDLSFLGWNILSACTLGILGILYVGPYQALTNAALYEKLRYGLPAPADPQTASAGQAPVAPVAGTPVPLTYAATQPYATGYAPQPVGGYAQQTAMGYAPAADAGAAWQVAPVMTADAQSSPSGNVGIPTAPAATVNDLAAPGMSGAPVPPPMGSVAPAAPMASGAPVPPPAVVAPAAFGPTGGALGVPATADGSPAVSATAGDAPVPLAVADDAATVAASEAVPPATAFSQADAEGQVTQTAPSAVDSSIPIAPYAAVDFDPATEAAEDVPSADPSQTAPFVAPDATVPFPSPEATDALPAVAQAPADAETVAGESEQA